MYLCPLGILIAFAAGVLVLSIVLPRLQERRPAEDEFDGDIVFRPEGESPGSPAGQSSRLGTGVGPGTEQGGASLTRTGDLASDESRFSAD